MEPCSNRIPTLETRIAATAARWVCGWRTDRDGVKGKLVEITADRTTHLFISRGEISFSLKVNGNALSGTAIAVFYDASGRRIKGPVRATLEGQRILP